MKQAQDDVKNQTSEFLTYASEVWYFKYIYNISYSREL